MKCKNCGNKTEVRGHKKIKENWLDPNFKKTYVFSEWDYCPNCSAVWHNNDKKILIKDLIEILREVDQRQTSLSDFLR